MPDAPPVPVDPRRCVVIPSYNAGPLLERTVKAVLAVWRPVIVADDGSTDGSAGAVIRLARTESGLHVLAQPGNTGKGAAVFAACNFAVDRGFTHAAVFDADGQHDPEDIPKFMAVSASRPLALVMGQPQFGDDAPVAHRIGHAISNFLARIESLRPDIGDSLFGLRVYPIRSVIKAMGSIRGGRRFDFDTQMAVRLAWLGIPHVNLPAMVRYPREERVRHFGYLRDNLLLARVHAWLLLRGIFLWPAFVLRRFTGARPFEAARHRD